MTRLITLIICVALLVPTPLFAQQGQGRGPGFGGRRGPGGGQGMGRGVRHGNDDRYDEDHEVFQYLLQNHDQITRNVKELPDGVETLTESDVPEIAAKIKEHVEWMEYRIENTNPIRMRDPLFAEIFKHTDKIKMVRENTQKGVRVIETSDDAYVAKLIQAHAKVLTGFVERGFAEAMKNHAVPGKDASKPHTNPSTAAHPVIADHGSVVKLADATQQPRPGSMILVDLTRGGDPKQLNAGLETVAKYVNIYAGAGTEPADMQIAVVFHGDATLTVLNPDAYAAEFNTNGNPNLALLRQLHESGVELYVCGQSLISKGSQPQDVVVFVETAVSALTAVVNLQADGYAYLPLGN
ncbi:DsrE/DsrF-like family protein [Rubripirellula tenax]|uniref:DsrE/DsrF-like family protein n=1 Tax=Rubripirellula tenax TaxID=2528015 RepID=A0A5C6E6W6_9BACT|nr:DsrE family protein [Rubripirellula tenax]TWU44578.1 DsrE/DsrF-like family protein [Rubripirellula tenax]